MASPQPPPTLKGEHEYDGIVFDANYPKDVLIEIINDFQYRDDDVIVASFPKSGTTWTQEITYLLCNGVDFQKAKSEPIGERMPFMEWCFPGDVSKKNVNKLKEMKSPRLFKTHLTKKMLLRGLESGAKFVVPMRNPKDVLVSYYHHYKLMLSYQGDWNDFFELFKRWKVKCGNWFDHVLPWWEERHRDNVFIFKYENLKQHPQPIIQNLAKFLGHSLSAEYLQKIIQHTSFEEMKNNPATNYSDLFHLWNMDLGWQFMRKGQVGDWKNHFTVTQNDYFDALYAEKLKGTDLEFQFEV